MLVELKPLTSTYLPNGTHPGVVAIIQNAFTLEYGPHPRFKIYEVSPGHLSEGYLVGLHHSTVAVTYVKNGFQTYPVRWELVHKIEFSNKRIGGVIWEIDRADVIDRFLQPPGARP